MANVYLDNYSLSANFADYANLVNYQGNPQILYNATFGKNVLAASADIYNVANYTAQVVGLRSKLCWIGARIMASGTPYQCVFTVIGPGNDVNCSLKFNSDNSISILDKNGVVQATSEAQTVIPNVPVYMELECNADPAVGAAILRISGVVVAQAANINTDGSGDSLNTGWGADSGQQCSLYISDIYVNDSTGSSWNSFMGDIDVQTILPTASTVSQLTPNGGASNAAIAAQIPPNAAVFNETETPGFQDVYIGNSVTTNTESVLLVVQRSMAFTTPGGTHNLQQVIVSEGSTTVGEDHPMTTANAAFEDRYVDNPTTGNPWTIADINAIQFGDQLVN